VIYSCDVEAEFSASLLQSSVSHDPSEILLICDLVLKKHFLLLSMLKTVVLLNASRNLSVTVRDFEMHLKQLYHTSHLSNDLQTLCNAN